MTFRSPVSDSPSGTVSQPVVSPLYDTRADWRHRSWSSRQSMGFSRTRYPGPTMEAYACKEGWRRDTTRGRSVTTRTTVRGVLERAW